MMTTTWYVPESLKELRDEVDLKWPNRDRTSDGSIGDYAHSLTVSQHNPDSRGCIHALDFDVDGIDPMEVVNALIRDNRTWYVIYNKIIYSRYNHFQATTYFGASPHLDHIHVSILLTVAAETDITPWGIYTIPTMGEVLQMELTDEIIIPGTYKSNTHTDGTKEIITVADFLRRVYEWSFLAAHKQP